MRNAGPREATARLVVNTRYELLAPQDLHVDPAEPDVVAGIARVEHLVADVDPVRVRADLGHDPRAAGRRLGRGGGEDEPGTGLGLVRERLHDDELVQRLECRLDAARLFDHASNDTSPCPSEAAGVDDALEELLRSPLPGSTEDVVRRALLEDCSGVEEANAMSDVA